MATILVVEDEKNIRLLIQRLLTQAGYHTLTAENGAQALDLLVETHVDLLVLDVMMPELDGFQVVKEIRQWDRNLPIILVTAKETVADKKTGFLAGADDYLVKPLAEEEFLLRVQALLRRAQIVTEHKITLATTELDRDALTVKTDKEVLTLPQKEFYLLYHLLSYPNKIFTRQQLMEIVWQGNQETDERTVDTHIKKIRQKFKDNQDFTIETIRGLGYKVVKYEKN